MLLFPLGLKAKTKQFPIATVIITFATVLLSVPFFNKIHQYQKSYFENIGDAYQARARLLLENCDLTGLEKDDCEFLKKNLSSEKPQNVAQEFIRLNTAAKEEFGRAKGRKKFKTFSQYLFEDKHWLKLTPELDGNPAFVAFHEAKGRYEQEMIAAQSRYNLLSNGNLNLKSVMLAQWTHGGWMHLLGNLLFFVLLAIPVEQRLGSVFFAALYVFGGTIGLSAQVFLYDDPVKFLVGASANVSAVAGAFLVLFFTLEMRIWFSAMFLYNRVVHIPTWIFIPTFIVLSDVTGAVSPEKGVAHFAHLFGFVVGGAMAFWHKRMDPLPKGFAFHFEYALKEKAETALEPIQKLRALWELLFYHGDNRKAQREAIDVVLCLPLKDWTKLPAEAKRVIKRHLDPVLRSYLAQEDKSELVALIEKIPESWPLRALTKKLNPTYLRLAGKQAEESGKTIAALKLYRLYLENAPTEAAKAGVRSLMIDLERRMDDGKAA